MTMVITRVAATSARTPSQNGVTTASASHTPRMVDATTALPAPQPTAESSGSRPVLRRYAAAMATIRNISMPSRSVTTIIWPISAFLGSGNEADPADARVGGVGHRLGNGLVLRRPIGAQVDFRLGLLVRSGCEPVSQRFSLDALAVPVQRSVRRDRERDVIRRRQGGV